MTIQLLAALLLQTGARTAPDLDRARSLVADLPLAFEENRGQADPAFSHFARTADGVVAIARDRAAIGLRPRDNNQESGTVVELRLEGAASGEPPRAEEPLPTRASWFIGNDRSKWVRGAPTSARVRCESVWPGIDVLWHGRGRRLEYDFRLAPGVDPAAIGLSFGGVQSMRIDESGALALSTPAGDLVQPRPEIYQEVGGERRPVAGSFRIAPDSTVGFDVGAHDPALALVIDPFVIWSTLFGDDFTEPTAVAVDASGIVVVGQLNSGQGFPFTGTSMFGVSKGGDDCCVMRFDPTGSQLLNAVVFGGSDNEAGGSVIGVTAALGPGGEVYLFANTVSTDLPTTGANGAPPFQATFSDDGGPLPYYETFVACIDLDDDALVYCTYLGGTRNEHVGAIAVDAQGAAHVVGFTASPDFPTRNAAQASLGSLGVDAFVVKLLPDGSDATFSTYDDVNGAYEAVDVVLGIGGELFVLEQLGSPTLEHAGIHRIAASGAFVDDMIVSGNGVDTPGALARTIDGSLVVALRTTSTDLPLVNAWSSRTGDAARGDVYVFVVSEALAAIGFSTYVGGSSDEFVNDVAAGDFMACVAGSTRSRDFPLLESMAPADGNSNNSNGFVLGLYVAEGTAYVVFSSTIPGAVDDLAMAVAFDPGSGEILVAGNHDQSDLDDPLPFLDFLPGSDQTWTGNSGDGAAYLLRLDPFPVAGTASYTFAGDAVDVRNSTTTSLVVALYRTGANHDALAIPYDCVDAAGVVIAGFSGTFTFAPGEQMATTSISIQDHALPTAFDVRLGAPSPSGLPGAHPMLHVTKAEPYVPPTVTLPSTSNQTHWWEGTSCAIEEVSRGSNLGNHLDTLRRFRDGVLNRFELGRRFTRAYYRDLSPNALRFVVAHPWLVPIVRAMIWSAVIVLERPLQIALLLALLAAWRARPRLAEAARRLADYLARLRTSSASARALIA